MLKKSAFTIVLILLFAVIDAQGFDWLTQVRGSGGTTPGAVIKCMTLSSQQNVYTCGNISTFITPAFGNIQIPDTGNNGSGVGANYFIAACDSSGNFKWVTYSLGPGNAVGSGITLDDHNKLYSVGYCDGYNFKIDTVLLPTAPNDEESTLMKLDENGHVLWIRRFGYPGGYGESYGQVTTYENNTIYDFAFAQPSSATYNILNQSITTDFPNYFFLLYVAAFDTMGNLLFTKPLAQSQGTNLSLWKAMPMNHSLYVTGFTDTDLQLDTFSDDLAFDQYQSFLARYDDSCRLLWYKNISTTTTTNFLLSLAADSMSNIIACGEYIDSLVLDSVTLYSGDNTYFRSFVCKMDSNGHLLWLKNLGGNGDINCYNVCQQNNRIYASGYFAGYLQVDTLTLQNLTGYSFFILEFDQSGNLLKGHSYGGNSFININQMGISPSQKLYCSGYYQDSTVLGPYSINTGNEPDYPYDNPDPIIFKYDPDGIPDGINTITPTVDNITLFPNPNNGMFSVKIDGVSSGDDMTASIYNCTGEKVLDAHLDVPVSQIDCSQLISGIYLIRLNSSGKETSRTFVINNK